MKGKMYRLPGTSRIGHNSTPKGPPQPGPMPRHRKERIVDHLSKTSSMPLPLPDKLRGR
jgi:hypothetical protein